MPETPPAPELVLSTPLFCQGLWGGGFVVAPVADPALACRGDTLAGCVAEQRQFLEEHLAQAEPRVVARFALPKGVRLLELEVDAPRPDLPPRLAVPGPVALTCVCVPFEEERWAFLPALGHAVRVEARDDFDAVVRAEAERLIAALQLPPPEWLRLLPQRAQSLEWIDLRLRRGDLDSIEKARAARRKAVKERRAAEAAEILASVAVALHLRPEASAAPALVDRERELEALGALLGARERTPALLVGPELCGKTALLYAWLRREKAAGRPRQVWATSASRLIAGMSGLGQWQERVRRVVEAAAELDAVLYFENVADLLSQHASESLDVAGALKPALEAGRVRFAGEIAPDSLDLLEARHAGFLSALARVRVEPLDARATERALAERVAFFGRTEPDAPNLAAGAVPRLVELVERYLPYRAFPGKAVRLLDELRAAHRGDRTPAGPRPLEAGDVYRLFSLKTGVPEFLLREDRALVAAEVERGLRAQLVGQDDAVRRVVEALCEVKAGLQPAGKPLATFLFVGPTGVGKTELARQLAAFLFGSPDRLFRFDMSEFADPLSAARLFQGTDRAEGLLTRRVRQQPFCVLLLDEIEKADPAVFDVLLQVLGEGRLSDARGRTSFFHNALVVLTSNLGAAHPHSALGIGASARGDAQHYRRAVEKAFRPELVNRIDHLVPFAPLGPQEARRVTRLVLERVRERRGLKGAGTELVVGDEVVDAIARAGYEPAYGARALRRAVEDRLVAPLAAVLSEARDACSRAVVTLEGGEVRVQGETVAAARDWSLLKPLRQVLDHRRFADLLFSLDAVEQLREQVAVLVAQLSGAEAKGGKVSPEVVAAFKGLRGEHQRLEALLREADEHRGQLEAAEELALFSYFGSEDPRPFVAEGAESHRRLRRLAPYLVLGLEPRRDEITLLLQEADDGGALRAWLAPLLAHAPRRRWTAEGRPGLSWDKAKRRRRWASPVAAEALASAIAAPERDFHEVLLHVRGRDAGLLLALEAGLHRFHGLAPQPPLAHLTVQPLAMRATLAEAEVEGPAVQPPARLPAKQLALMQAVRDRRAEGTVHVVDAERRVALRGPEDYWEGFEEIALEHLLHFELAKGGFDRESAYRSALDQLAAKKG